MSRTEDDLRRDLKVIAERATPSPDAWTQIQSRIADQEPIQETEIIMLTENTLTRRRWPLVAAAAAVVAIAIGAIALVNRDDGAEQPADVPEPVPTVAPEPADPAPNATAPLPEAGEIPPGKYSVDSLGVPITFETTGAWTVEAPDAFGFSIQSANGFVAMTRIGSFYDANEANDPATTGLGSISPDDVDTWIDVNGVIVDQRESTTVGDRPAEYRQVRSPANTGDGICPADERACLLVGSRSADIVDEVPAPGPGIDRELAYSLWFVDMGDFEPVEIWAYSEGDHEAFIEGITPLLDSIEFGDLAPAVEGGTARIPERYAETGAFEATRTVGEPLADGSDSITTAITLVGDVDGEVAGEGVATTTQAGVDEEGTDEYTFTGTIAEAGSGTVTYTLEWQLVNGVYSSTGLITGGTGDFDGVTGTTTTSILTVGQGDGGNTSTGTITFYLALPRSG